MNRILYYFRSIFLILIITEFLFATEHFAQFNLQTIKKELSTYLREYQKNKLIPGISAGIAKDSSIFWLDACGFADVENNAPAAIRTHFRIASISKSITAVAVMQLVEKGKIKLDADARTYIPYFPKKKWNFTVRQLLNHTSGIRNYYRGEFDNKQHYPTIKDAVGIISKDTLVYQPGTKYLYTTLGYNLLGSVIENVSGLSFDEYIKKNIFEPSDMKSTFLDSQEKIIKDRARLYTRNKFRILENGPLTDLSNKYPGGGLISTSEDLLKFSMSLLEGKLIKPGTLDSMLVPSRLKNGTRISYGLGFTLGTDNSGRKYFAHEGYSGTSLLIIYPAEKLVTVDLINVRDRNNGSAALDLASFMFDNKVEYPKAQLSDRLMETFISSGIDSVISKCNELQKDSSDKFDISLNEISVFGYDLIGIKRTADAIQYFKFMIKRFPDTAKPYIGLADAYYKDGNIGLALTHYRLAFKIERSNAYALSMIQKITKTK